MFLDPNWRSDRLYWDGKESVSLWKCPSVRRVVESSMYGQWPWYYNSGTNNASINIILFEDSRCNQQEKRPGLLWYSTPDKFCKTQFFYLGKKCGIDAPEKRKKELLLASVERKLHTRKIYDCQHMLFSKSDLQMIRSFTDSELLTWCQIKMSQYWRPSSNQNQGRRFRYRLKGDKSFQVPGYLWV